MGFNKSVRTIGGITLNWQKLFEIQAGLDQHIADSKGLQGQNLLDKKILALQVELGELANEWRGFKFWKEDKTPITLESRLDDAGIGEEWYNPLLEEYVDCLHFILSIGLELNIQQEIDITEIRSNISITGGITDNFQSVYRLISVEMFDEYDWFEMIEYFNGLGGLLGFTEEQIEQAYLDKNKVNHERQNTGY